MGLELWNLEFPLATRGRRGKVRDPIRPYPRSSRSSDLRIYVRRIAMKVTHITK